MHLYQTELFEIKLFLHLTVCKQKTVFMLNWFVWNKTVYMYKNGFGIEHWLICHKTKPNSIGNTTRILRALLKKSWKQYPNKTTAVRLPTSYFTNHPSETNKTYEALQERIGESHKQCSLRDSYTWTHQYSLSSENLYQLCPVTECSLKNRSGAMDDREGQRERERERVCVCMCVSGYSVPSDQLNNDYNDEKYWPTS